LPPCGAELNPTENVWAEAKRVIAENWPDPSKASKNALWYVVLDAWEEVAHSKVYAATQLESLPRRIQMVIRSRGSSGGIVTDYGLDDRVIEVRSPTEAEDFSSSPCVKTGSGAHPASYPMGTGGSFPGGKARPGRDADHSPPSSAKVKNE
jgi:hypothetical protein